MFDITSTAIKLIYSIVVIVVRGGPLIVTYGTTEAERDCKLGNVAERCINSVLKGSR